MTTHQRRRHDHAETVTLEAELVIARAERDSLRTALTAVMQTLDRMAGDPNERAVWSNARALLYETEGL